MANLIVLRGTVSEFERTTNTSGANGRTTTTHISLFRVDSQRVILRTRSPSVISDGDEVVLSGRFPNGRFAALACNNKSAGWISPLKQQGCVFALLVFFTIAFSLMTLLFFLFVPFPIFTAIIAFGIKKHDRLQRKAYEMVLHA